MSRMCERLHMASALFDVANSTDGDDAWTCCSSSGGRRKIHFILVSRNLECMGHVCSTAVSRGVPSHTSDVAAPRKQPGFQQLLTRRMGSSRTAKRREPSKQIRKSLRAFQRKRQNQRLNGVLQDFQDLGRLDAVFRDLFVAAQHDVNKMPKAQDFAACLADIFRFDRSDPHSFRHVSFADIPRFELSELSLVLQRGPNGKTGDETAWCGKCSTLKITNYTNVSWTSTATCCLPSAWGRSKFSCFTWGDAFGHSQHAHAFCVATR